MIDVFILISRDIDILLIASLKLILETVEANTGFIGCRLLTVVTYQSCTAFRLLFDVCLQSITHRCLTWIPHKESAWRRMPRG